MTYGDFKYLPRITASDKILRDEAFTIAKSPKYDEYQRGLALMAYTFFHKNSSGSATQNKVASNQKNYMSLLLEYLKNGKGTYILNTLFWVLIQQICNQ